MYCLGLFFFYIFFFIFFKFTSAALAVYACPLNGHIGLPYCCTDILIKFMHVALAYLCMAYADAFHFKNYKCTAYYEYLKVCWDFCITRKLYP